MPDAETTRQQIIARLAEQFGPHQAPVPRDTGDPKRDRGRFDYVPDGNDAEASTLVVFQADDGQNAMRPLTYGEIADALCGITLPAAVTEWGFRYSGEGEPSTVMPYPLTDVQQLSREFPRAYPSVVRAAVSRQVGPWTVTEIPASVACRHCFGPIIPCEPAHQMPVCLGWKHTAHLSQVIGAHYCEGRSVNPSAEPEEDENHAR